MSVEDLAAVLNTPGKVLYGVANPQNAWAQGTLAAVLITPDKVLYEAQSSIPKRSERGEPGRCLNYA